MRALLMAGFLLLPAWAAAGDGQRCQDLLGEPAQHARAASLASQALPAAQGAERAALLICRGYLHEAGGRLNEAGADYEAAIAAARAAGDEEQAAQALAMRGELRYQRGELHQALVDLQAAYRSALKRQQQAQILYALNALANLYTDARIAQHDKALDYYRQLLAAHEARGSKLNIATAKFNIGATLGHLQRLPEALDWMRRALADYQQLGDAVSVAETQRNLASLLLKQGQAAQALPLAEAALQGAQDPDSRAHAQLTRAVALRQLGRLAAARADLQAARGPFEREGSQRSLERLAGELAELEAAAGQWQAAYAARGEQQRLQLRLQQLQNEQLGARLRVEFDSERKELENRQLQREAEDASRIRRLQLLVIALAGLLLLVLAWLARRAWRQARQMRRLALSDELTGLPNRRAILGELERRLHAGAGVAALIFDIDHFKRINDSLGHDAGDAVLREVAAAARAALAPGDRIGRIGGEEFLVLPADAARLAALAEALRAAVAALRLQGGLEQLALSISVGGACSRADDSGAEALLKRADLALYQAKEGGRNRVVLAPA